MDCVKGVYCNIRIVVLISLFVMAFGVIAQIANRTESGRERIAILRNSISFTTRWPMIIQGYGQGTFALIYLHYDEPVVKSKGTSVKRWPRRAHNDLLQSYVELGAVGATLYLIIALSAIMRGGKRPESIAFIGLSLCGLMDLPLQMPTGAAVWWMLAGIINSGETTK